MVGGAVVTGQFIVWAPMEPPTTANTKGANPCGTGSFLGSVSGLPPGPLVFARAFATNEVGTAYGEQIEFKPEVSRRDPGRKISSSVNNLLPLIRLPPHLAQAGRDFHIPVSSCSMMIMAELIFKSSTCPDRTE